MSFYLVVIFFITFITVRCILTWSRAIYGAASRRDPWDNRIVCYVAKITMTPGEAGKKLISCVQKSERDSDDAARAARSVIWQQVHSSIFHVRHTIPCLIEAARYNQYALTGQSSYSGEETTSELLLRAIRASFYLGVARVESGEFDIVSGLAPRYIGGDKEWMNSLRVFKGKTAIMEDLEKLAKSVSENDENKKSNCELTYYEIWCGVVDLFWRFDFWKLKIFLSSDGTQIMQLGADRLAEALKNLPKRAIDCESELNPFNWAYRFVDYDKV